MEEIAISPQKADWFLNNFVEDENSKIAQKLKRSKETGELVTVQVDSDFKKELLAPIVVAEVAEKYQKCSEEEKKNLQDKVMSSNSSGQNLEEFFQYLEEYPDRDISKERAKELVEGAKDLL